MLEAHKEYLHHDDLAGGWILVSKFNEFDLDIQISTSVTLTRRRYDRMFHLIEWGWILIMLNETSWTSSFDIGCRSVQIYEAVNSI